MSTRRTRVYVAGPMLTSGNPYQNVRDGLRVGTTLVKYGYKPCVPHLTAVWEIAAHEEFTYEEWLELDFSDIQSCDVLLRLPGESKGADREVAFAHTIGVTVYYSLDTLLAGVPATKDASVPPPAYHNAKPAYVLRGGAVGPCFTCGMPLESRVVNHAECR